MMSPRDTLRLELLRSAPSNSWIALSNDESRIVATGATFSEVAEMSDRAGGTRPAHYKNAGPLPTALPPGLKPICFLHLDAALKGRSSTCVLPPVFVYSN